MYQQITIVGNVGRDPELRYTNSGIAVCDFSVAVNRRTKNQAGEPIDETTWFRVTAWRQTAEVVAQYLKKGRQVMVVGTVKASAYLDKAGQPAATLEITANEVKFLGGREGGGMDEGGGGYEDDSQFAPPPPRQGQQGRNQGRGGGRGGGGGDSDDIPF